MKYELILSGKFKKKSEDSEKTWSGHLSSGIRRRHAAPGTSS